jgi:hypothetical protein
MYLAPIFYCSTLGNGLCKKLFAARLNSVTTPNGFSYKQMEEAVRTVKMLP